MSKRFWIDNGEIVDSGFFLSDKQNYVDVMNKLEDKCSDLEAKLAEKERDFDLLMLSKNEEINEWIAVRDDKNKVIDRQTDKINELKQQLAEKDKEIEEVRSNHANLVADIAYKAVNVYTAESRKTGVPTFYKIHYSQLLEIEDMANLRNYAKDKTEFAIQQLQRVKEKFGYKYNSQLMVSSKQMVDFVDQIINELKGENCGYK